jgi:hypothetical protein
MVKNYRVLSIKLGLQGKNKKLQITNKKDLSIERSFFIFKSR